ncbi:hypothetical protein E1B28_000259 [Marasmius oreades]|uniref:Uncharacterized protein n=1 Tax=Marasmius oreades TaxID=181124 RepID=A0A9P7V122_9AGAR|nr:uncharacterized protein E1B28_000259 [Marasmius oreades]KAG7098297.1 hypothetical protein E1B28_000259 [Marasmius oreades]
MAPVDGIPPDIAKIAGPIIITFMLGSILYGVQVLQVYMYYLAFPKDRGFVKYLVYTVFLLDTLQTALFFHDAFNIFGAGFGDLANLRAAHLTGFSVPILTGLVSLMVQSFYARQIRMLSRSTILVGVVIAIALVQFGAAIWTGYLIFRVNNNHGLSQQHFVQSLVGGKCPMRYYDRYSDDHLSHESQCCYEVHTTQSGTFNSPGYRNRYCDSGGRHHRLRSLYRVRKVFLPHAAVQNIGQDVFKHVDGHLEQSYAILWWEGRGEVVSDGYQRLAGKYFRDVTRNAGVE